MTTAKDLHVAPISSHDARKLVRRIHYSGKIVQNSNLHFGVFLNGKLEGVMQFGSSMRKDLIKELVAGTGWNGFLELNRMAFSEALPRNSESRALGVAFRSIRKHYPHIEWVVSFADGTQCGDGTIYRASGFVLTGIKINKQLRINPATGSAMQSMAAYHIGKAKDFCKWKTIPGFQLRYIYFLTPAARERLTVPILPFSKIQDMGAGMYRGEKITRTKEQDSGYPPELGGATPTRSLHIEVV